MNQSFACLLAWPSDDKLEGKLRGFAMSLKVIVKNARNLPNLKDEEGLLDAFVAVKFRGTSHAVALAGVCSNELIMIFSAGLKKRTEIIDDNLNPQWNEVYQV